MQFPLASGNVLGARYLVERLIGAGGMAVVAVATDLTQGQRVAIKMLLPEAARSDMVLKRFQREQRTLNKLTNEHAVRMLGAGTEGDYPYMVMEYLEGSDLSDMLKMQGALPLGEAVEYVLQACEAIAEAHALGITHRDLKPGNMFLIRKPNGAACIKVLDFGISKTSEPHQKGETTLTGTTALLGSPFYMSPEQLISSRDVDTRTDIWSMGVTLHELLSNTLPFGAKTTEKVCKRILNDTPTPLRQCRPDLPEGLETIILKALQRKPAERFANISDFAMGLTDFAPEQGRHSVASITDFIQPTKRLPSRAAPAPTPDAAPSSARTLLRPSTLPAEGRGSALPPERASSLPAEPRLSALPYGQRGSPLAARSSALPLEAVQHRSMASGGQAAGGLPDGSGAYPSMAGPAATAQPAAAQPGPGGAEPGFAPGSGFAGQKRSAPTANESRSAGSSTATPDPPTLQVERQKAWTAKRLAVFLGYGMGMLTLGFVLGLVVRQPAVGTPGATAGADSATPARTSRYGPPSPAQSVAPSEPDPPGIVMDLDSASSKSPSQAPPPATGSAQPRATAAPSEEPTSSAAATATATARATASAHAAAASAQPKAGGGAEPTSKPKVSVTPDF